MWNKTSVKGTKCGKSAKFGTCLQKWFSLGIIEGIMRLAKECKSMPTKPVVQIPPDEERKNFIKGMPFRNDMAIAMFAASIKAAMCIVKAMKQRTAADDSRQNCASCYGK